MKKRITGLILALVMCLCVNLPAAKASTAQEGYDTLSLSPSEYLAMSTPKQGLFCSANHDTTIMGTCEAFLSMGRASVRDGEYRPALLVANHSEENPMIQYRLSEYDYLAAYWNALGVEITNDDVWYSDMNIEINGDSATASIVEHYTYYLSDLFDDANHRNREYTFTLERDGDSWSICKITTNDPWEDESFEYIPLDVDTAREIATTIVLDVEEEPAMPEFDMHASYTPYRWEYNTDVAVEYAEKYYNADSNGGYNPLFNYLGANCQNFASQCVWAGLIGNMSKVNNATSRSALPAVSKTRAGADASNIWCYGETSSQQDGRCSWYSVNGFALMIAQSSPSKEGPFGSIYYGNLKYAKTGSVIINASKGVTAAYGKLKHAMFVTDVTGTSGSRDVSNIKIAANNSSTSSAFEPLGAYSSLKAENFATCNISCGYYSEAQK